MWEVVYENRQHYVRDHGTGEQLDVYLDKPGCQYVETAEQLADIANGFWVEQFGQGFLRFTFEASARYPGRPVRAMTGKMGSKARAALLAYVGPDGAPRPEEFTTEEKRAYAAYLLTKPAHKLRECRLLIDQQIQIGELRGDGRHVRRWNAWQQIYSGLIEFAGERTPTDRTTRAG